MAGMKWQDGVDDFFDKLWGWMALGWDYSAPDALCAFLA